MTAAAKKDIERFKNGEPLDHIIGFVDFLGCKILVDKNVLIPRVETEVWVEQGIEELSNPTSLASFAGQNLRILDMFAGSGAIGIAIMRHVPGATVTFVDSEAGCIKQIKKNLRGKKAKVIKSDIFEKVSGKFDYIFANPPYISTKNKHKVQKSVIQHEPHVALFGGGGGLRYIRRFLAGAKNRLNLDGKIYMEFDPPQKPAVSSLLKKYHYATWDFHKDQYGKSRYVVVQ